VRIDGDILPRPVRKRGAGQVQAHGRREGDPCAGQDRGEHFGHVPRRIAGIRFCGNLYSRSSIIRGDSIPEMKDRVALITGAAAASARPSPAASPRKAPVSSSPPARPRPERVALETAPISTSAT